MQMWFQKQLLLDSQYSGSFFLGALGFLGFLPFPRGSRVRVWFVVVLVLVVALRDVDEVLCRGVMDWAEVIRRMREMACTVEG